ncbi:hypothetical protein M422DRAFT_80499, partial [Sphaerobolus stellatus SS14]
NVIASVMGMNGTGKSSFIKLLTGNKDIKVGQSINPETMDIATYQFLQGDGLEVTLVDTPGFDDTRPQKSDSRLLGEIIDFLLERQTKKSMNGLIYFHRISDVRFGNTATHNIRMFSRLCGPEAMRNVVILTTRWDETRHHVAVKAEAQLMNSHFKEFVDNGAQVLRHNNTVVSARGVVSSILALPPIGHLQIVDELLSGRSLFETEAGRELDSQLAQLETQHVQEINALREQYIAAHSAADKALQAEIKSLREELLTKLRKVEKDKVNLARMKGLTSVAAQGVKIGANIPFLPGVLGPMVGGALGGVADH